MGMAGHSDFMEEETNQYILTKFRDENGGAYNMGRRPLAMNMSRGHFSKASSQKMDNVSAGEMGTIERVGQP